MNVESARTLFAYNQWANERMLRSVATLSSEELKRELAVSFGSLLATLAHIIGVEQVYLQRWAGKSPSGIPDTKELPDLSSLQALWRFNLREQGRFVENLTDEKLQQPCSYINFKGERYTYPLHDMVQHFVNHSTYHRGQVVFLLRLLGKQPLSTDYLRYFDELGK